VGPDGEPYRVHGESESIVFHHSGAVTGLSLAGRELVTCSLDSTIRVWDTLTDRCVASFLIPLNVSQPSRPRHFFPLPLPLPPPPPLLLSPSSAPTDPSLLPLLEVSHAIFCIFNLVFGTPFGPYSVYPNTFCIPIISRIFHLVFRSPRLGQSDFACASRPVYIS